MPDLLTHLTPCPVVVTVGGADFTVPALDAIAWVRLLTATPFEPYSVFPILAGKDAVDAVEDALWAGEMTEEELGRLGLDVVSTVADRPWWEALRILSSVAAAWEHIHVNHAKDMSFAGWLDEVWAKTMSVIDPKTKPSYVHQIQNPPKGWESEVDFDEEEKAFMAAMRAAQ